MSDEAQETAHDDASTEGNEPEMLEVTESNESGNDKVNVLEFDVVVSPDSSVSVFYHVVVNEPKAFLRELSVSFVRTQDGVVQNTVAGSSHNNAGQGVSGALDVLPGAFNLVEGNGAGVILSGWVGGQAFFFRKPVELELPSE